MAPVSAEIRMQPATKLIRYEDLLPWRASLALEKTPLVVTNGCFDLLHPGHLFLLQTARALGNTLLVGVTGDAAVRTLKGSGRPAMPERDRLLILSAIEAVSYVCLFPDVDATLFLEMVRPDIYVKGGDYSLETINQRERHLLERLGSRIEILPRFEQQSTTQVVRRILDGANPAISA